VRTRLLLVDFGIAIVVAVIVLAITPGLAVAAAIAVVTLGACAISFRRDARRRRRRTHASRRGKPTSRV
jgi:Flp pilus assembly protein TadB